MAHRAEPAARRDAHLVAQATEVLGDHPGQAVVVVDEAHHLADDALHAVVAPLCRASFGALLLTATPVRLDPREYFRLLSLVETVPSTTLEAFLARLEAHEAYAGVARDLLAGGKVEDALVRLRELSPDDEAFDPPAGKRKGPSRAALLEHLAGAPRLRLAVAHGQAAGQDVVQAVAASLRFRRALGDAEA